MNQIDEYARSVGWASEAERRAAIERERRQREGRREAARLAQEELAAQRATKTGRHAATDLGVTARECTPEELRAGRIALGLDAAE